jgi:predicted nucleic acid-binding protein
VPLLVAERRSRDVRALYAEDNAVIVWWATEIECASAVSRLERDGELTQRGSATALDRLDALVADWQEISPSELVRRTARRLLRLHPLRTADAFQLAAANVAGENDPTTLELVACDSRLADAARREGFVVLEG